MAEDFLSELREAGTHEGDGAFTLDRERAARVLGQYRLDDGRKRLMLLGSMV